MAITNADIINVAPELVSVSTGRIDSFIAFAAPYVNINIWGEKADFAHSLLTAHLLTLSNKGGATNVTSEKVGDLSVSYADPTADQGLESTAYGSMFVQLRKSLLISPIVVT